MSSNSWLLKKVAELVGEKYALIAERDNLQAAVDCLRAEKDRCVEAYYSVVVEQLKTRNAERARLIGQLDDLLDVTDKLLNARNAVIRLIPECRIHGDQCLPNARRWIRKHVKKDKKARKKAAQGKGTE